MRGIKRPAKYEAIVRLLAERNHPCTGKSIFPTMRDLLCFAAIVGFAEGKRSSVMGEFSEIDSRIFENSQQAMDLVYLIALVGAKTAEVLQPDHEDEMLAIFEEYAAAGLGVIDGWLKERADDIYGDQALLFAFRKYGYLGRDEGRSTDPSEVSF